MLIVETISKIRRLAHVQGKTIKAICRELGVSRKVVRRVLRSEETEFKYERSRQPQPKLGPWRDHLDGILLANEAKASRERLTLIRIFEDLRDLGYTGGYDTVRRYARSWSQVTRILCLKPMRMRMPGHERFLSLEHLSAFLCMMPPVKREWPSFTAS